MFVLNVLSLKQLAFAEYDEDRNIGLDDKPWLTLGYTNGPGFYRHRVNVTGGEEMTRRDLSDSQDEMREIQTGKY